MPDISSVIRDAATANGVDPAILAQIAQVESGGDPNAAASGSSAKGLFQFTSPTWAQYGKGDPLDPAASADAGARLLKDNAGALAKGGYDASPGNIYLSHFAGAGGAAKVLGADPSAPVSDILGAAAVKANPFLANMTAADLRSWADRKMGGQSATAAAPVAQPRAPQGGILNQGDQTATAQPGVLNTPEESPGVAFQNKLAELAAQRQPAPVPQLAPIQMAVPKGINRARLLAALSQPVGT